MKEIYWKWNRYYVPPKWRGAAEHKRAQLEAEQERDRPMLEIYAARKAALPTVIRRRGA